MSKTLTGVILGAATMLSAAPFAAAHTRLDYPPARDMSDSHKDTNGGPPCGIARTAAQPSTSLAAGATVTMKWTETVNHPGCFLVDFAAAGDANFQMLANVKHVATGATPRAYSQVVTLPATGCPACTLRVRQIMLASETAVCPPATIPTGVTYYACANVVLGGGSDAGAPLPDAGGDGRQATGGRAADGGNGTGGGGDVGSTGGMGATGGVTAGATGGAGPTGSGGSPSFTATGGVIGSGGVTASGGVAGPASGGTGGSGVGSGGAGVGSGGTTVGGPSGTSTDAPSGCACDLGGGNAPLSGTAAFAAVLLALLLTRRARRATTAHPASRD